MSTSGYEIRHAILQEATALLTDRWHAAMDVERISAEREQRNPVTIPAPTVEEIKSTAESLYEFVQKKS
jgi:hypothetical protein